MSPYIGKWDMEKGEMDGPCTSVAHYGSNKNHKATFFDKSQSRWVCFTCAQQRNRTLLQSKVDPTQVGCVSGRDYMLSILLA